jgi:manganese transport protein
MQLEMPHLALGILGATVYLHSGLVQTRGYGEGTEEKREAIKLATIDSSIALCLALTINASILILAAARRSSSG